MLDTATLLGFCQEQTHFVESRNLDYYWQAGEYKLFNRGLVDWYERKYHQFVPFVGPVKQLRDALAGPRLTNDEFAALIAKRKPTRLMLSGGRDSVTILDYFHRNNLKIDEVFQFFHIVNGVDSDSVNEEQLVNGAAAIEQYQDCIQSIQNYYFDEEFFRQLYRDPYCRLNTPFSVTEMCLVHDLWQNEILNDGYQNITGFEKPMLIYYHGCWYATVMDHIFLGRISIPNAVHFWLEPENIHNFVEQAKTIREKFFSDIDLTQPLKFCEPPKTEAIDSALLNNALGRVAIEKELTIGKISKTFQFHERDKRYIQLLLDTDNVDILINFGVAVNNAVQLLSPGHKLQEDIIGAKFPYFINIDTLEVHTQQELIPDGFKI